MFTFRINVVWDTIKYKTHYNCYFSSNIVSTNFEFHIRKCSMISKRVQSSDKEESKYRIYGGNLNALESMIKINKKVTEAY